MGCNCKRNKARVLTPKMLIRQQEEAKRKEAQENGKKD